MSYSIAQNVNLQLFGLKNSNLNNFNQFDYTSNGMGDYAQKMSKEQEYSQDISLLLKNYYLIADTMLKERKINRGTGLVRELMAFLIQLEKL